MTVIMYLDIMMILGATFDSGEEILEDSTNGDISSIESFTNEMQEANQDGTNEDILGIESAKWLNSKGTTIEKTLVNSEVVTKFYSQDETLKENGDYTEIQTNQGVKKIDVNGTETLMEKK